MAERNYNGPVIDCTWSNGPWSNDGETIEASDDDAKNGNMDTIEWPEGATPREELNDDQIAVIEKAARYRNIDNSRKLSAVATDGRRSESYAATVLKTHWPERYWVDKETTSKNSRLGVEDVKEVRTRVLNGESIREVAKSFPVSPSTLLEAVKGEIYPDIDGFPPLEYDDSRSEYVEKGENESTQNVQGQKGSRNPNSKLNEEDVVEMRERAIAGEDTKEIVKDFPVRREAVIDAINGCSWDWLQSPPPLKYNRDKRKYTVPDGEQHESKSVEQEQDDKSEQATLEEQQQEEQEQQAQDTSGYDPTPVAQESSTDYTKYISIVAVVYMAYRVLRRLF